jgi:hypothetical protein
MLALARIADILTFFLDPILLCRNKPRLRFHYRTVTTVLNVVGIGLASAFGVTWVAGWQLAHSAMVGLSSAYLIGRTLRLSGSALLAALGPAVFSAALAVCVGEFVYREVDRVGSTLQFVCAVCSLGLIALATPAYLFSRGKLALPSVTTGKGTGKQTQAAGAPIASA